MYYSWVLYVSCALRRASSAGGILRGKTFGRHFVKQLKQFADDSESARLHGSQQSGSGEDSQFPGCSSQLSHLFSWQVGQGQHMMFTVPRISTGIVVDGTRRVSVGSTKLDLITDESSKTSPESEFFEEDMGYGI